METKTVLLNNFPTELHKKIKIIAAAESESIVLIYQKAVENFLMEKKELS